MKPTEFDRAYMGLPTPLDDLNMHTLDARLDRWAARLLVTAALLSCIGLSVALFFFFRGATCS